MFSSLSANKPTNQTYIDQALVFSEAVSIYVGDQPNQQDRRQPGSYFTEAVGPQVTPPQELELDPEPDMVTVTRMTQSLSPDHNRPARYQWSYRPTMDFAGNSRNGT